MCAFLLLRRQYSSALPLTALGQRLQHTVPPRPTGLLWWLGIRRLPCWGRVEPATHTFRARMPWGRSDGPVIAGRWQVDNPAALPLAGTTVQLTIRLPLANMLGGGLVLTFLLGMSILLAFDERSLFHTALVPGSIALVFGLLFLTDSWWSIRRAERHFIKALLLTPLASKAPS